ncbi:type II toxin-antitoxin system VapC family toxin [Patescibacteria group bacterium]|nr:type II toxin-antitoxin system VapC family toxin [Patescibacteria group bacterium]
MYTLDTNIVIYFLKGELKVKEFLREKTLKGSRFFISTISEAELFGYPEIASEEILKIDEILRTISIISIDSQIARLAGFFKRNHNASLPDSIIAATSYLTNTVLLTRNIKDFRKIKEISTEFI